MRTGLILATSNNFPTQNSRLLYWRECGVSTRRATFVEEEEEEEEEGGGGGGGAGGNDFTATFCYSNVLSHFYLQESSFLLHFALFEEAIISITRTRPKTSPRQARCRA